MNSTSSSKGKAAISSMEANSWMTARLVAPKRSEKGFLSLREYSLYLR
jgi:hypothetical protein